MGLPQNRAQLADWCLTKLGSPVIKINVAQKQIENRIDETLERFREHHFDGSYHFYMKHRITGSKLTFTAPLAFTFSSQEKITGQTSGAVGFFYDQAEDNLSIRYTSESGTFVDGEVIQGDNLGHTGTLATTGGVTLGDKDNGWVPCDDSIISVSKLVRSAGLLGTGLFSFQYQQALQVLPIWPRGSLNQYFQLKNYLHLIEEIFVGDKVITYQRLQNRIYIDADWKHAMPIDDYIIFDTYKAVDPEAYKKLYSNYFVREYTTALIKKQWGQNLTKFKNITMPGGVTMNGGDIYDQAEKELAELEKKLRDEFQAPPMFFMG